MTVGLRPAVGSDLAVLLALEQEAMGTDAWGEQVLRAELTGAVGRHVLVAVRAGDVCGYAVLGVVQDVGDVHRVAVAAGERRRGIGRLLLDALVEAARGHGCGELLLEVDAANVAGAALYAGAGFTEVARRAGYYRGGRDALVMRRGLG